MRLPREDTHALRGRMLARDGCALPCGREPYVRAIEVACRAQQRRVALEDPPLEQKLLEEPMNYFSTNSLTTGALLFGGDWACAHGDLETLSFIARELSTRVVEPLKRELADLEELCRRDEELAARRWPQLRNRMAR
jgi:hypothetical protein